jgi:murein DD-endopeptidase MepM/ murein hydrolase activator NlpD
MQGPLKRALAAIVVAELALATPAALAEPVGFSVRDASVGPKRAFFGSAKGVRISFTLGGGADSSGDVVVTIRGHHKRVRRWGLGDVKPGDPHRIVWDGVTAGGKAAPDGAYRAFARRAGSPPLALGRFRLYGHMFPVRGPHGTRGAIGEFGAPRDGGRVHEGFDVVAACGTRLDAVRAGKVVRRGYDPVLYGNYVLIKGAKERYSYFYAHLTKPAPVKLNERVTTAERVGEVGRTGNARSVPGCHLHFEIHRRGHPIDPEPFLGAWDRYS